jgi:hypothetical protein
MTRAAFRIGLGKALARVGDGRIKLDIGAGSWGLHVSPI